KTVYASVMAQTRFVRADPVLRAPPAAIGPSQRMINRVHGGWLVIAAAAIGVFMTTPGQTVGVSSFVDLLAADTGLTRERVLLLYSLGTLLGILPAPLV